jgi:5-bromo-4-chloroindolyl phosphate hydrolysis protein
MNPFLSFFIRTSVAIPTTLIIWLISYFGFDQTFLLSSIFSVCGGILISYIVKGNLHHRYLKKQQLTRKEYKYIKENLAVAKKRLSRLNKALLSYRYLKSIKQRKDILLITRKIYSITKKEPKRFYKAEKFYFSHLESLVELTEKYVFLSSQPLKTRELDQYLSETRKAIEDFSGLIEKDLNEIIAGDIEQLNFELDVVKHIKSNKDTIIK